MSMSSSASKLYRWWLLDGDLELVSDGSLDSDSLQQALAGVNEQLERLGEKGLEPCNHPYRLIVCKGHAIVAVRPPSVGIC